MKKFFILTIALLFVFSSWQPLYGAASREKLQKAPDFPWGGIWLNTPSFSKSAFRGKVTLVYFWDYTSINAIRELEILKEWYEKYKPYGFRMVWIHSPEYEFGRDTQNVEDALKRLGVYWPVFLDNDFKLWDAYKTRTWPTKYLVGRDGEIFHQQVGEQGYIETETRIREGLRMLAPSLLLPEPLLLDEPLRYSLEKCGPIMGETPIGYKRFRWWGGEIANKRFVDPDGTLLFKDRGDRVERGFFVEGLWTNQEEGFIHARDTEHLTDYLGLLYKSYEVYSVVNHRRSGAAVRVYVTRNGTPVPPEKRGGDLREDSRGSTYFLMQEPRLYYLIRNESEEWHELRLWARDEGVTVNAFSFSNRCLSEFEHI